MKSAAINLDRGGCYVKSMRTKPPSTIEVKFPALLRRGWFGSPQVGNANWGLGGFANLGGLGLDWIGWD